MRYIEGQQACAKERSKHARRNHSKHARRVHIKHARRVRSELKSRGGTRRISTLHQCHITNKDGLVNYLTHMKMP